MEAKGCRYVTGTLEDLCWDTKKFGDVKPSFVDGRFNSDQMLIPPLYDGGPILIFKNRELLNRFTRIGNHIFPFDFTLQETLIREVCNVLRRESADELRLEVQWSHTKMRTVHISRMSPTDTDELFFDLK